MEGDPHLQRPFGGCFAEELLNLVESVHNRVAVRVKATRRGTRSTVLLKVRGQGLPQFRQSRLISSEWAQVPLDELAGQKGFDDEECCDIRVFIEEHGSTLGGSKPHLTQTPRCERLSKSESETMRTMSRVTNGDSGHTVGIDGLQCIKNRSDMAGGPRDL